MIKQLVALGGVALAMVAAPVLAQDASAQQTTRARFERTDTPDQMQRGRNMNPNDRVCRSITATGSRLGSRRVCQTRAEWDGQARNDREATDAITRTTRVPGG